MTYKVKSITDLDGNPRTDGRYPLRIGRVCEFLNAVTVGQCLYIKWILNSDGLPYGGWIRTSLVCDWSMSASGCVVVTTCNSIYTFEPYQEA